MDRTEFLNEVCARVRVKSVHSTIKEELSSHIDEIKETELNAGLPPEEAEKRALLSMGSPGEIGERLDKEHRPKTEWSLLFITAAIAIVGLLIAFAAGGGNRKTLFTLLGLAVMVGVMFLDYTWLRKRPMAIYLVFCGLLLALPFISIDLINGRNMIFICGFRIISPVAQFGQLAPVLLAGLIASKEKRSPSEIIGLIVLAAIPVMAVGRGSMAYGMILTLAYIIIFAALAAKGERTAKFLLLVPTAMVAAQTALIVTQPYRLSRITTFLSGGQSDPAGVGYISVQLSKVVKSARLFSGVQSEVSFLTLDGLDEFTLVGILGRFGWIPTIGIIVLVAALIWRMFAAAGKIKDRYGFMLALSGCSVLAVKFIYNIFMNFGLLPTLGISLPIIGGGGTDYVITMAVIGLILSVYRRNDLISCLSIEKEKKDPALFWHHVVDVVFGK